MALREAAGPVLHGDAEVPPRAKLYRVPWLSHETVPSPVSAQRREFIAAGQTSGGP
jgi:hypothetical protein